MTAGSCWFLKARVADPIRNADSWWPFVSESGDQRNHAGYPNSQEADLITRHPEAVEDVLQEAG